MTDQNKGFEGFAILELMGHRRLAGYITEQEIAGKGMIRIDIPNGESFITQFYSPESLYSLTPTTEEIARAFARHNQPQPVHRWELPKPKEPTEREPVEEEEDEEEI